MLGLGEAVNKEGADDGAEVGETEGNGGRCANLPQPQSWSAPGMLSPGHLLNRALDFQTKAQVGSRGGPVAGTWG